jgi:hypothetical protein
MGSPLVGSDSSMRSRGTLAERPIGIHGGVWARLRRGLDFLKDGRAVCGLAEAKP